jgi:DNA uptake protein ComE-like DNA-binding protein
MSFFREYFQFTRKERNGILFLIAIVIALWILYFSIDYFKNPQSLNYSLFENQVDSFYVQLRDSDITKLNSKPITNKFSGTIDVNHPDVNSLISLGVSKKIANAWVNYTSKGGKFKTKEDVKKIWGMTDALYYQIASQLTFSKDTSKAFHSFSKNNFKPFQSTYCSDVQSMELNTADSIQIVGLPSIGESFAHRIIAYRSRLGGFYQKEQLLEIYGFTQELLTKISPYIIIDSLKVKKVHVNQADYKTMVNNPYFSKEIAKEILQYRKKNGKFLTTEELLTHQIISVKEWEKLKRYVEL